MLKRILTMSTKREREDDGSPDTEARPVQCTVKVVLPDVRGPSGRPDVLSYTHLGDAPQTLEKLKTQALGGCPNRYKKGDFRELVNGHFFMYIIIETATETGYHFTHKQLTEATYQAMLKNPERRNGPGRRFVLELDTPLYMAPMVQGLFNPVTLEEQEELKAELARAKNILEQQRRAMIDKMIENRINGDPLEEEEQEEEQEKQQLLYGNLWASEGRKLDEDAVVTPEMIDRMKRNLELYGRNRAQFRRNGESRAINAGMLCKLVSKGVNVTFG